MLHFSRTNNRHESEFFFLFLWNFEIENLEFESEMWTEFEKKKKENGESRRKEKHASSWVLLTLFSISVNGKGVKEENNLLKFKYLAPP